jgi:hypothetical protein
MGSFGFLHFVIVIGVCAAIYYFVFRPDVHLILPLELKGIENNVKELLEPVPMDYEFVVETKERLRKEFVKCSHLFRRNPPGFSKEEAKSLRTMVEETKEILRSNYQSMEKVQPLLEEALSSAEAAAEKLKNLIKLRKDDVTVGDDESEDEIDNFERLLESTEASILKYNQDKRKLEYSLEKYGSL